MGDFEVLYDDDEQQWLEVCHSIQAHRRQHDDDVEVHPSQVCAKATSPVESIGVGDVRVERGPGQIQPGPHPSWMTTPIAASGGVSRFMERGREHDRGEKQQEVARVIEGLAQRLRDAVNEEQPYIGRHESGECDHDDHWVEQGREDSTEAAGRAFRK